MKPGRDGTWWTTVDNYFTNLRKGQDGHNIVEGAPNLLQAQIRHLKAGGGRNRKGHTGHTTNMIHKLPVCVLLHSPAAFCSLPIVRLVSIYQHMYSLALYNHFYIMRSNSYSYTLVCCSTAQHNMKTIFIPYCHNENNVPCINPPFSEERNLVKTETHGYTAYFFNGGIYPFTFPQ